MNEMYVTLHADVWRDDGILHALLVIASHDGIGLSYGFDPADNEKFA